MKTGTVKSESLLNKILDIIKHSALFEMFFNPSSGMVVNPDEVDTEKQIKDLSASTGMSEKDLLNIDAAFNNANGNLETLEKVVAKVPEEPKDAPNPFAVDEEDLILDSDANSSNSKEPQENDREIGE